MKKISTLICLLAGVLSLSAQNQKQIDKSSFAEYAPANLHEQHSAYREPAAPTVQYTTDVIIDTNSALDQRRVRISVAFNGWLYAAYSTVNASNQGGITIRSSRDNGIHWTTLDSYSLTDVRYTALDIVVAGTDTNNLVLYLAGINNNISTGNYILFVDRYDATTGAFNGSNFNYNAGTRQIYDVSLASDYRYPGAGASPYSVGMLYSTYTSALDSLCFVCSLDGGSTWGYRQTVATTGYYHRKVSLSYGRSASGSNGRYFGAWEQLPGSLARNGNIFTSRSQSTVDGAWIPKVNVDSVSSAMIGLCKNPEIATSFNNTDNDSGSVTAVILVQRDYTGDGSDYDLLGFYNKRAHYTSYWNRLDIVNTGEKDIQPDVSFDPANNNFLATYYDSTNGKLPYVVNGFNLATPSAWTTINPQYNDANNNLKAAWPRVEINPVVTQAAHAWIAEGAGTNGVAMFDAEYNITSVHNAENVSITKMYPNPTANTVNISYTVSQENPVTITVYNMLGETVEMIQPLNNGNGTFTETIDASSWANGIYTVSINCNGQVSSGRIVVSHQ